MRTYDYYRSGQFNGKGPVLYMFNYYRPDGGFGSCECVEEEKVTAHLMAIWRLGYRAKPGGRNAN